MNKDNSRSKYEYLFSGIVSFICGVAIYMFYIN